MNILEKDQIAIPTFFLAPSAATEYNTHGKAWFKDEQGFDRGRSGEGIVAFLSASLRQCDLSAALQYSGQLRGGEIRGRERSGGGGKQL